MAAPMGLEQENSPHTLERVWAWLHQTFPERQIYVRSNGRVQFFTFGPSLQATMAGLGLIFLGWVAFATINVVFKDRIIAAKDHHYQEMQSAYESRLADLQGSYNQLNGALTGAEDKFKAGVAAVTAKQNAITGFLDRKRQLEASMEMGPAPTLRNSAGPASVSGPAPVMTPAMDGLAGDNFPGAIISSEGEDQPDSSLAVMPGPVPAQPRVEKPLKSSLLEKAWTGMRQLASSLFDRHGSSALNIRIAYSQHPALKILAAETARIESVDAGETRVMQKTEMALAEDVGLLRATVRRTGINPDQLPKKAAREGMGGPEIPLSQVRIEGIADPEFTEAFWHANAVMSQLDSLSFQMGHIPFTTPVVGAAFDRSSGFGPRIDPFTRRYAFHPGVDFAGPWGATVTATAPGVVTFAGANGGYGNMVEIDHGFGLHTRYGHLSRIMVAPGTRVTKGSVVGRLGSTGRSTGPHVHYEVWYNNVVRNPTNFIEAGRHVL
ncbi:MAG TPA: peptidoglycan DD-metalloendopeptidase family protein [Rhizomicrobium sp.]|nr:peptidoglycan DD-metalloendopeptidase family protein [Rhizomicrobium sp.]